MLPSSAKRGAIDLKATARTPSPNGLEQCFRLQLQTQFSSGHDDRETFRINKIFVIDATVFPASMARGKPCATATFPFLRSRGSRHDGHRQHEIFSTPPPFFSFGNGLWASESSSLWTQESLESFAAFWPSSFSLFMLFRSPARSAQIPEVPRFATIHQSLRLLFIPIEGQTAVWNTSLIICNIARNIPASLLITPYSSRG